MTAQDPQSGETEQNIETNDSAPTAHLTPASTPIPPRHSASMSSRRKALSAFGIFALLIALLSASIFAARGLTDSAPVAPEASLLTTIQNGQQAISQATGPTGQTTQTSCNCTSKHSAYAAPPFQPSGAGQVVLVSLSKQQLWAFQNGRLVLTSLVTTGMPQLPTPTGTYHIMMKESNIWFYSPWPYGSPYYYSPEHIDYAMLFRAGGFYLHNAPWRETFGPGTKRASYRTRRHISDWQSRLREHANKYGGATL
jgi:lipoprotein-anchoring transpeptidase ErfK/SrfK